MIEKFKKSLDQGGEIAALLTGLSKAFDCLPYDLIITKLHPYGFDKVVVCFRQTWRRFYLRLLKFVTKLKSVHTILTYFYLSPQHLHDPFS